MPAPTIVLIDTQTMTTLIENKFKYTLFGADSVFDQWADWVNDSSNTPTHNELANVDLYDGYAMKWWCDTN